MIEWQIDVVLKRMAWSGSTATPAGDMWHNPRICAPHVLPTASLLRPYTNQVKFDILTLRKSQAANFQLLSLWPKSREADSQVVLAKLRKYHLPFCP
jgi:hypothetical protein